MKNVMGKTGLIELRCRWSENEAHNQNQRKQRQDIKPIKIHKKVMSKIKEEMSKTEMQITR